MKSTIQLVGLQQKTRYPVGSYVDWGVAEGEGAGILMPMPNTPSYRDVTDPA